jgi:hypothetical protein
VRLKINQLYSAHHGKIRLIDGNENVDLKIDLKRDLKAGVYLFQPQNPIITPPPFHTVYVYTLYRVLIHTGGGGGRGGGES